MPETAKLVSNPKNLLRSLKKVLRDSENLQPDYEDTHQGTEVNETHYFDDLDLSQAKVIIDGDEANNYSSVETPQLVMVKEYLMPNIQDECSNTEQGTEKNRTYLDLSQAEGESNEASEFLLQPMKKPRKIVIKKKVSASQEDPRNKRIKSDIIDKIAVAVDTLREISQSSKGAQSNEYDAFGKVVAAHLRNLPEDIALEGQGDILNYLVQRRLGRKASFMSTYVSSPYPSPQDSSTLSSCQADGAPPQLSHTFHSVTSDILNQDWNSSI